MTYKINSFFTRLLITTIALLGAVGISTAKSTEVEKDEYIAAVTPVINFLLDQDPYSY